MDEAFQTLLQLLKESGQGAETTIISIHDGVPSSGLLRPEVFPEVREAIDRKLAAAIEKSKLFPPNVQQEFVRRIEEPLYNPETREFEELYAVQLPLEVKRVVGLASNLKAFKPRFITIDFKGVPTLAEMHAAAGGSPDDLLQISPSEVIQHLHKRNVTSLARIVQLPDVQIQATPEALEATTDLTIDPIADEVLVTIELTPAQPEFLERSELTISSAGFETSISDDTEGAEFHVCRDAQNNVATISLRLQNPRSESIRIDWKSRQGDSTVPAMQIRSWMRLKESIAAELYPEHIDPSGTIPIKSRLIDR